MSGLVRVFFTVAMVLMIAACSAGEQRKLIAPGATLPLTRLTTLAGEQVSLQRYLGRTTVLVFWASWCSKSKTLLQKLDTFASRRGGAEVDFLLISVDQAQNFEAVREFTASLRARNFTHFFSGNDADDETFTVCGGDEIPLMVVLDRTGRVTHVTDSYSELVDALK